MSKLLSNLFNLFSPFLRFLAKVYTAKERTFTYKDIKIIVKPGVFHPGLYFSTIILLKYAERLNFENKTFLELGAGTGLISIFAALRGANVTATDINKNAIENIKQNFAINNLKMEIIFSNLFQNIPKQEFDIIIINPPYFNKTIKNDEGYAWNCGKDHEYFRDLFFNAKNYINKDSEFYMILSDKCDTKTIKDIALLNGFNLIESYSEKKMGEKSTISRVCKI